MLPEPVSPSASDAPPGQPLTAIKEFDHDRLAILSNSLVELADRLDAAGVEEHIVDLARGVASVPVLVDVATALPTRFKASTLLWLVRSLCCLAREEGGEFEMFAAQVEATFYDAIGITDGFQFAVEYFHG